MFGVIWIGFGSPVYGQQKKINNAVFSREDSLKGGARTAGRHYRVSHYRLQVRLFPEKQSLQGEVHMQFRCDSSWVPGDSLRVELHPQLAVEAVFLEGHGALAFHRRGRFLWLKLPGEDIAADSLQTMRIQYQGQPPVAEKPPWQGGFVWSRDSLHRPWVAIACQGVGASVWWPCKDHPTAEPDSVDLIYEVPAPYRAVANGRLQSVDTLASDGRPFLAYHWKVRHPINLYNITLNMGHYRTIGDSVEPGGPYFRYQFLDYHRARAAAYLPDEVRRMFAAFHHWFGPYPFPKDGYQVVETPYLGMEHQSAVAYGNQFERNRFGFDFILVHETAHEYWGNSLSAPDQGELWIHESFATYAEALYMEYHHGYPAALKYLQAQRTRIRNQARIFGPRRVAFHAWPDNDLYYKGAWVLHTFRHASRLNATQWQQILRALVSQYAHQIVSTAQLTQKLNHLTATLRGKPLSWGRSFWDAYLKHPDLPLLEWRLETSQDRSKLHYRWVHPVADFSMPVKVRIGEEDRWLHPQNGEWQVLKTESTLSEKDVAWPKKTWLVTFKKSGTMK